MVRLDPSLKARYPTLVAGYAILRNVKVRKEVPELNALKEELFKQLKEKYGTATIVEIPEVRAYRTFFRALGTDPSRYRPPAEYLLRRALQERFPTINSVVDTCLLVTVKHWITTSVFDLDKVKGEATLTIQSRAEPFELIDGRILTPPIGEIVVHDDEKIVSSYTLGDAKATMVTPETKNVLVVAWNAPGIAGGRVKQALEEAVDCLTKFSGATLEKLEVFE